MQNAAYRSDIIFQLVKTRVSMRGGYNSAIQIVRFNRATVQSPCCCCTLYLHGSPIHGYRGKRVQIRCNQGPRSWTCIIPTPFLFTRGDSCAPIIRSPLAFLQCNSKERERESMSIWVNDSFKDRGSLLNPLRTPIDYSNVERYYFDFFKLREISGRAIVLSFRFLWISGSKCQCVAVLKFLEIN